MVDQVVVTVEAAAVEAELHRIIRAAEDTVRVRAPSYRPWLFRVIQTVHPEITRQRWREITGWTPDTSLDMDQAAQRRAHDEDRALLRQHGRGICCPACDATRATELRRELNLPERDEAVRTCQCDACEDEHCRGDCERCDDHGCEACYRDHTTYSCCGYCEDCDAHVDSDMRDEVCDRGYCHECDHRCNY